MNKVSKKNQNELLVNIYLIDLRDCGKCGRQGKEQFKSLCSYWPLTFDLCVCVCRAGTSWPQPDSLCPRWPAEPRSLKSPTSPTTCESHVIKGSDRDLLSTGWNQRVLLTVSKSLSCVPALSSLRVLGVFLVCCCRRENGSGVCLDLQVIDNVPGAKVEEDTETHHVLAENLYKPRRRVTRAHTHTHT